MNFPLSCRLSPTGLLGLLVIVAVSPVAVKAQQCASRTQPAPNDQLVYRVGILANRKYM